MKKYLLLLVFPFVVACSAQSANDTIPDTSIKSDTNIKLEEEDRIVESFKRFFTKFSKDSTFQKSNVLFPLLLLAYDIDNRSFSKSNINRNEWTYTDFQIDNRSFRKTHKLDPEFDTVNIQQEDSGISVNYLFRFDDNVKLWTLVKIVDEST